MLSQRGALRVAAGSSAPPRLPSPPLCSVAWALPGREREKPARQSNRKLDLGARRPDASVALRIERDNADRRPVTRVPTPPSRVTLPRNLIDRVAGFEQMALPAGVTLCRGNVADAAVPMLVVV